MRGKAWFERHWKPVNSLGYRDAEPFPPKPGQKSLVVLGDSFAAGHGVNRAEDRFSSVAATILGQDWQVFNVAKIGWDTMDETRALKAFPVKPDVVVLAYYLNDIFHAAQEEDFPLRFGVNLPRGLMKALTDHSAPGRLHLLEIRPGREPLGRSGHLLGHPARSLQRPQGVDQARGGACRPGRVLPRKRNPAGCRGIPNAPGPGRKRSPDRKGSRSVRKAWSGRPGPDPDFLGPSAPGAGGQCPGCPSQ